MKAVLISIQPKWCELIANGKKTVEVRKTRPKIETPFKCYIYCTMPNTKDPHNILEIHNESGKIHKANGKVIGEFVCNMIGKVGWITNPSKLDWKDGYNEETCLSNRETYEYTKGELFYEWFISDLVIYDKPKDLNEFVNPCIYGEESDVSCFLCDKSGYRPDMHIDCFNVVERPPQSWCYVDELGD